MMQITEVSKAGKTWILKPSTCFVSLFDHRHRFFLLMKGDEMRGFERSS
jgi:hypothetical protein